MARGHIANYLRQYFNVGGWGGGGERGELEEGEAGWKGVGQLVKCLVHKLEDPSSELQHSGKMLTNIWERGETTDAQPERERVCPCGREGEHDKDLLYEILN